jgi:hypothetical protein
MLNQLLRKLRNYNCIIGSENAEGKDSPPDTPTTKSTTKSKKRKFGETNDNADVEVETPTKPKRGRKPKKAASHSPVLATFDDYIGARADAEGEAVAKEECRTDSTI